MVSHVCCFITHYKKTTIRAGKPLPSDLIHLSFLHLGTFLHFNPLWKTNMQAWNVLNTFWQHVCRVFLKLRFPKISACIFLHYFSIQSSCLHMMNMRKHQHIICLFFFRSMKFFLFIFFNYCQNISYSILFCSIHVKYAMCSHELEKDLEMKKCIILS